MSDSSRFAHLSRRALKRFLQERRQRLRPHDVGLVRPLRPREYLTQSDVAELLGVSVKWYETFESGRGNRRVSTDFLNRLSSVLRLKEDERRMLIQLAGTATVND